LLPHQRHGLGEGRAELFVVLLEAHRLCRCAKAVPDVDRGAVVASGKHQALPRKFIFVRVNKADVEVEVVLVEGWKLGTDPLKFGDRRARFRRPGWRGEEGLLPSGFPEGGKGTNTATAEHENKSGPASGARSADMHETDGVRSGPRPKPRAAE
jgi:hypothetical protein